MLAIAADAVLPRHRDAGHAARSDGWCCRIQEMIDRVLADAAHRGAFGDQPAVVVVIAVPGAEPAVESPTWGTTRSAQPVPLRHRDEALSTSHGGVLTRREREVAALVAGGCTNRQIAQRLHLSTRTAESHVEHILNKLAFTTRAQIAAWAVATGAADPPGYGAQGRSRISVVDP